MEHGRQRGLSQAPERERLLTREQGAEGCPLAGGRSGSVRVLLVDCRLTGPRSLRETVI